MSEIMLKIYINLYQFNSLQFHNCGHTTLGNFLTLNSDQATMERNSGLFWAMLQCSLLIGNTFVYFQFQGLEDIDKDTRTKVRILTNFHVFFNQLDCCFDTQPFLIDSGRVPRRAS